jgi:hypothetical protein
VIPKDPDFQRFSASRQRFSGNGRPTPQAKFAYFTKWRYSVVRENGLFR